MSVIAFTPLASLCLGSGKKPGHARVVACRRLVAEAGKGPEVCTVFLDEKKGELRVWSETKGLTTLRGAGKYATRVVDAACDDLFTAVFFHHDKGRRLGLAVLQHSPSSATRLVADPLDYSESLDAVLAPLIPSEKKGKEMTTLLQIHCSCLKQTASSLVVSTVLSTPDDKVYVMIGALRVNLWRCHELNASFGIPACLRIQSERVVSVMSSSVETQRDHSTATTAPSVELALSVFDQTSMIDEKEKDNSKDFASPRPEGVLCCVLLREAVFSLDDSDPTIRVCYQSQLFRLPEVEGGGHAAPLCRLYADLKDQHYAAVVSIASGCYIVHLRRSPLNMELLASCTKIGLQGTPHGVTWLRVPHPSRPEQGLHVVVVLSQDYHACAAEVFGDTIDVQVVGSGDAVRFIPPPKSRLVGEPTASVHGDSTCLMRLANDEILCSNGLLCVALRVTGLTVGGGVPREILAPLDTSEECPERRVIALVRCLQAMERLLSSGNPGLFQLVFQRVLPMLQCTGPSQREVFLTQRVFEMLLSAAAPKSVLEWRTMWSLTRLLQKTLSKRFRDNSVLYTDIFFIYLVENYIRSHETPDERDQAVEGLLSVVSDELKLVWKSFTHQLEDDVSFVLDSLAERISLVVLAEECVRRMVVVSTLSNGTHVVLARPNASHVVHTIALALLASCLKVPVYVDVDDVGGLRCCVMEVDETLVFVPPHSFKDNAEFEYALTLSTDMLCTTAPDTPLTQCAAALLSMLLARRYHVMATFLQIFALPLIDHLTPLEPLCDNVRLLTECSAAVSLTESALFRTILSGPQTSSYILSILCSGSMLDDYFNAALWQHIGDILSKETRALVIAALLHAMTDRAIAAQNNYSTSVVKAILREKVEEPLRGESVETCRKRLKIILARLEQLWASAEEWSPYKVEDIETSVLSVSTSMRDTGNDKATLLSGSVVSRTHVMCFRVLSLIGYSYHTEERIAKLIAGATSYTLIVHVAFELIRAIDNLKGTALPVEVLQWRCVDLASSSVETCSSTPGLATFLLKMLQLSEASSTSITSLKQYYYAVEDRLTEASHAGGDSAEFHELCEQLGEQRNTTATPKSATAYFPWTKKGGAVVPDWPGNHSLTSRRYLINTDWVDAMWPIEFAPQLFKESLSRARERILSCGIADGPEETEFSPQFAHALYRQICTLSPPVRTHALLAPPADTQPVGAAAVATRSSLIQTKISPLSGRPPPSSPQKVSPVLTRPVSASPQRAKVNDEIFTTSSSSSASTSSPVREAQRGRDEVRAPLFSAGGAVAVVGSAAASALFPPDSVAWWENDDDRDESARRQRIIQETLNGIDIEITTSATSYTTLTSERLTHTHGKGDDSVRSLSFSPRRCKRHQSHHYRCAKHRSHGRQGEETVRLTRQPRHKMKGGETHPPHMISLSAPKAEEPTSVKLLQFQNVLQPPPLPLKMVAERSDCFVEPQVVQRVNDLTPPQLLSLRAQPHIPRVKLFALSTTEGGGEKGPSIPNEVAGPSIGFLARPSSPLQTLAPPSVPASCVFVNPSLLTLKPPEALKTVQRELSPSVTASDALRQEQSHAKGNEEPLCRAEPPANAAIVSPWHTVQQPFQYQQQPQQPLQKPVQIVQQSWQPNAATPQEAAAATFRTVKAFVSHEDYKSLPQGGAMPFTTGRENSMVTEPPKPQVPSVPPVVLGVDFPKDGTSIPASTLTQPVVSSIERSAIPVSAIREPVLSPSENAAFHKYVDELKAKGTAIPLPSVPVPGHSFPAPVQTTPPVQVAPQFSPQQQQHELLEIKEAIARHEEQHARQFQSVIEAIRSNASRPLSVEAKNTSASQNQAGLSAMEQAELVRHTIQQKDRLMIMNQELLELHSRAQRLASTPVHEPPQQSFAPRIAPSEEAKQQTVPLVVPVVAIPPRVDAATSARKSEVTFISSGVQTGTSAKRTEDSSTMTAPQSQIVEDSRGRGVGVSPDVPSTMSIDRTLSSLHQINADLMRVNATTEDMEQAILESRSILQKHASLGNAHSAAVEGSLMMDAARRRTAALEQQLTTLNATSVRPTWGAEAGRGVTEPRSERAEWVVPPSQHTFLTSTAENDTVEGTKEAGTARTLTPPRFHFTGHSVEANKDSTMHFDPPPPPPQPITSQERGVARVFHSHAVTELQQVSLPVYTAAASAENSHEQTPTSEPHTTQPVAIAVANAPPPPATKNNTVVRRRTASSPTREAMDLGQLYASARAPSGGRAARKCASPAKKRTKALSPPSQVPARFAMYMPAAVLSKTQRGGGSGNSKVGSGSPEPRRRSSLSDVGMRTTTMTMAMTAGAPRNDTNKVPSSGRDNKRRDTLALHTSKRLAELQRAFL